MAAVGSTAALLERLAEQTGSGARAAVDDDAVDGVQPRMVAEPTNGDALAATLAWAATEQLQVRVAGGRTKLQWGSLGGDVDLLLSTGAIRDVVEHRYGDLTATVEAGATLATVNARLAAHGQRLPWDAPWPDRATVGGVVATNDSGPRRHGHGAPRDSIIGITLARIDGRVAKAGGVVVKNVAGYDLSRLLTGSFGCLGVILTATFKLAPVPPASRTVELTFDSLEEAAPVAARLAGSALAPVSIELAAPRPRLLVRFESVEEAASQQADAACAIAGADVGAVVHGGGDEQAKWRRHLAHWSSDGTLVKLSTVPAELFPTLVWLRDRAEALGLGMAVAGRAALGVVDLRLDGALEIQARLVEELRERLPPGRGSAVIRCGEPALRRHVDPWGSIGAGRRVMETIKRRFDPHGLLNTGCGPGGL